METKLDANSYANRVPLPTDSQREYKPHDVFRGSGADRQRNIFGVSFSNPDLPLSEFEFEKLAELEESWAPEKDPFSDTPFEETQKLRFLQGCGWDIPTARDALIKYTAWRKSLGPLPNTPPDRNEPRTWFYFYGHDKCFRPIVVVDARRLLAARGESVSTTFVEETIISAMRYFQEYLAVPGHVEQILAVVNMDGCSAWEVPVEDFKRCIRVLTSCYRARLNKLLVINSPYIFFTVWRLIRGFLPERTAAKVNILSSDYLAELLKLCDEAELDPSLMMCVRGSSSST